MAGMSCGDLSLHIDTAALRAQRQAIDHVQQHLIDLHRLAAHDDLPGLDARQIQQIASLSDSCASLRREMMVALLRIDAVSLAAPSWMACAKP